MAGNPRQQLPENSVKSVPAQSGKVRSCTTCAHLSPGNATLALQRANVDPRSLRAGDILQLQRIMGNQAVAQMFGGIAQRQSPEEEEPLQGKFTTSPPVQLKDNSKPPTNKTGMPDQLKTGLENLSGMDMSSVRVHYNSSKPAQLGAFAYTQGADIHVAPGQERHLPHEGWHAVQQKQGRVQSTMQMAGTPVNDDVGLEREADLMGAKARTVSRLSGTGNSSVNPRGNIEVSKSKVIHSSAARCVQKKDVNIDKVKATAATPELEKNLTLLEEKESLLQAEQLEEAKPGYIGEAIIYAGESNASGMANDYVEKTQDWDESTRKSRLGVNFGINKFADFDLMSQILTSNEVRGKTLKSFNATKDKVSTKALGFTWGYSYEKGGLDGKRTTAEVRNMFKTKKIDNQPLSWKENGDEEVEPNVALGKFRDIRKEKGIPYGALRSLVGKHGDKVQEKLESNNASPVYIHSLDADAPNFETLMKENDGDEEFLKVLDAYDQIFESKGDLDMIIGGYNLIAQEGEYTKPEDFNYTIQSNVVDLAIRMAVHDIAPEMTYPTEPNFLIKANTYKEVRDEVQGNVWGDMAIEGRNLYDNLLKKKPTATVEYNPLASVPTGVKGSGGARFKIEAGKRYDKNSLRGQPQGPPKKVGEEIPLKEQYIVQAQSLAGATRLAFGYCRAFKVKFPKATQPKKNIVAPLFAPVEKMVLELLNGSEISDPDLPEVEINEDFKIAPILTLIQEHLKVLKGSSDFADLVEN